MTKVVDLRVLRDKILGQLYPKYGLGMTVRELRAAIPGTTEELLTRELRHLVDIGHVRPPFGWRVVTLVSTDGEVPEGRFDITAQGRLYLESKTGDAEGERTRGARNAELKRMKPDLARARKWVEDALVSRDRAREFTRNYDHAGCVASCQEAVEFSSKALFPIAGFEIPMLHGVGRQLGEVRTRVQGEEAAVRRAIETIARLAWLSEVGDLIHQVAKYGYLDVSAKEVLTTGDAEVWLQYADEALSSVPLILSEFEEGKLGFR